MLKQLIFIIIFIVGYFCELPAQIFTQESMILSDINPFDGDDSYLNRTFYDLNNDGHIDLLIDSDMVSANSGNTLSTKNAVILLGDSKGNFTFLEYYEKPSEIHHITDLADYNNDGHVDMLMYHYWSNGFFVYEGNDEGLFTFDPNPTLYGTGTHGGETKWVDYDADGDLDIFSISSGSGAQHRFHVFTNENNTFTKTTYNTPAIHDGDFGKLFTYYRDFNNDQLIDAFIARKSFDDSFKTATLLLQNDDNTFKTIGYNKEPLENFGLPIPVTPPGEYNINGQYVGINFEDYNSDGLLDCWVENRFNGSLFFAVFLGNEDHAEFYDFANPIKSKFIDGFVTDRTMSGTSIFTITNLDGNESFDIVANHERGFFVGGSLTYITDVMEDEAKIFDVSYDDSAESDLVGYTFFPTTSIDINYDGLLDIVTNTSDDNQIRVFLNDSETVGIKNDISVIDIQIYPNPVSNFLTIESKTADIENIKIIDVSGKLVSEVVDKNKPIDVSDLTAGVYFLNLSVDGINYSYKYIKE